MKRFLSTLVLATLLVLQTSCSSSNMASPTESPFSNGTNERNMVVVISDIHLGADLAYAEINKNLPYLAKFLEQVRVSPNVKELIIAGDLLDEWFVPATTNTYQGKDQKDFVKRIAAANKIVFDALNRIIQENMILVTYVPGNHDLTITTENVNEILPGIRQARDKGKLGLGTYSPSFLPELAVEHGHRFNFFCAPDPISNQDIASGTILPPGYFYTRLATLHVIQGCKKSTDTLESITIDSAATLNQKLAYKYWTSWAKSVTMFPINNKFDEKIFVTNINGFTNTYSVNDFMPYQIVANGDIDMNLFKDIQNTWKLRQTANNVLVHIPTTRAIDLVASADETDYQAQVQYFQNQNSNKRLVVFGHSHIARVIASNSHDGKKCIYANSGTWIDKKHGGIPTAMNYVVITPQSDSKTSQTYVRLYNFENGVHTFMQADSLRL